MMHVVLELDVTCVCACVCCTLYKRVSRRDLDAKSTRSRHMIVACAWKATNDHARTGPERSVLI